MSGELPSQTIVVTTHCLYKNYTTLPEGGTRNPADTDGIRGDLARELLAQAASQGVRVVVADGGSSPNFLTAIEPFKERGLTIVTAPIPIRAPQRRSAFERALEFTGARVIVYTQPEKVPILPHLDDLARPILEDHVSIVVGGRQSISRPSYPEYMWDSEQRVNKTYNWLLKKEGLLDQDLDWFFGVVAFSTEREVVSLFLERYEIIGEVRNRINALVDPERHSGGHYFPVIKALWQKMKVVGIELPFAYPETQKINETSGQMAQDFRLRRQQDATTYRLEAIHFLAYLKDNANSKIRKIE